MTCLQKVEAIKDFANEYPYLDIDLETVKDTLEAFEGIIPTHEAIQEYLKDEFGI